MGTCDWRDLLLVAGKFVGISPFGITGLVCREGYTCSVIGKSMTIRSVGVCDWNFVRLEIGDTCS